MDQLCYTCGRSDCYGHRHEADRGQDGACSWCGALAVSPTDRCSPCLKEAARRGEHIGLCVVEVAV
jgi:hypothetical protein